MSEKERHVWYSVIINMRKQLDFNDRDENDLKSLIRF